MDQGYLMAVQGVRRRQKFEVAEVGAEHDDAAARIAAFEFFPVLEALVGDTVRRAGDRKTRPGARTRRRCGPGSDRRSRTMRRRSCSLRSGKRDRQIDHRDRHVAAIQQKAEITAQHPEPIQNKIGQQAERDHDRAHQLEQPPVLAAQLESGKRRALARVAPAGAAGPRRSRRRWRRRRRRQPWR